MEESVQLVKIYFNITNYVLQTHPRHTYIAEQQFGYC